jgi:hypothetical protein
MPPGLLAADIEAVHRATTSPIPLVQAVGQGGCHVFNGEAI